MQATMGCTLTKNKNGTVMMNEPKEDYFIQNGAILLEKQIALSQGQDIGARELKIFSSKDIQKANFYDSGLTVGESTPATVYTGFLDNRSVAVIIAHEFTMNLELINRFLTEVSAGMVMNHDNMVKLYGCCLETCIPILVYDRLPRGILFDYVHGKFALRKSLKWADYLRVLTDVSYALSYMHNGLSKPVVHRAIQSCAILLDDSFHAKLANFGYCVSITPGDTSQRWPVEGTPGYIDPEYLETHEVTDKCDVYSYGVLMLELLTGKQPFVMAMSGIDLVDVFVSAFQRNSMAEMIDNAILKEGTWSEIEQVGLLALNCVEKKADGRPTMMEVVSQLWRIGGRSSQ